MVELALLALLGLAVLALVVYVTGKAHDWLGWRKDVDVRHELLDEQFDGHGDRIRDVEGRLQDVENRVDELEDYDDVEDDDVEDDDADYWKRN